MRRLWTALAFGLAVGPACASDTINGGGSSFVNPLMTKWTAEFERATGIRINYQSVGSGAGIKGLTAHDYEFACTDALLVHDYKHQKAIAAGELLYVPLVLGGIVPIYNLPDAPALNFTGEVLADIFLGRLTRWDDPRLAAVNPGVALPDESIVVVRRSDGSGSTFILSAYLRQISPDWKATLGLGNTLKWPDSTKGAKGTEGVAGTVLQTPYAIGYVELTYAVQAKLSFGAMRNAAGAMVRASAASVTAAAANMLADKDVTKTFQFSLANAPGKGSYPIAGACWAVLSAKDAKPEVVRFLRWTAGPEAQRMAAELDYAPLPPALTAAIAARLERLK